MTNTTHKKIGLLFGLVLSIVTKWFPGYALISYLAANVPDIDIPQSRIGRRFNKISKYLFNEYGHRNQVHSLLGCLIATIWVFVLLSLFMNDGEIILKVTIYFAVGYLSHLYMDMMNKEEIWLLFPKKKRYSLANVTTNSDEEKQLRNQLRMCVRPIFFVVIIYWLDWI